MTTLTTGRKLRTGASLLALSVCFGLGLAASTAPPRRNVSTTSRTQDMRKPNVIPL
jgi:hypothetical protein